jgi:hypothetical protein
VSITLWHNLHADRTGGWRPHHPMQAVLTFTLADYLSRGDKDTRYDLDHLRARFAFTGDPGDDEQLRTYQNLGLRPLEVGDVIEISARWETEDRLRVDDHSRPEIETKRWRVGPDGWLPVLVPLTTTVDNEPPF